MTTIASRYASVALAVWLAVVLWVTPSSAEDAHWGFGTDIGFVSGTVDGTVFALGFNLDYYVDRNFSFGPMALLSPTGDLTQIAVAGVAKYHLRLNNGINVVPFAGLGLIHADLDRGTGPNRIDRNDTSHYIPLGVSLEYQVAPKLALSSTLLVNLHNINLAPSLPEKDHSSVALMFGMRWGP